MKKLICTLSLATLVACGGGSNPVPSSAGVAIGNITGTPSTGIPSTGTPGTGAPAVTSTPIPSLQPRGTEISPEAADAFLRTPGGYIATTQSQREQQDLSLGLANSLIQVDTALAFYTSIEENEVIIRECGLYDTFDEEGTIFSDETNIPLNESVVLQNSGIFSLNSSAFVECENPNPQYFVDGNNTLLIWGQCREETSDGETVLDRALTTITRTQKNLETANNLSFSTNATAYISEQSCAITLQSNIYVDTAFTDAFSLLAPPGALVFFSRSSDGRSGLFTASVDTSTIGTYSLGARGDASISLQLLELNESGLASNEVFEPQNGTLQITAVTSSTAQGSFEYNMADGTPVSGNFSVDLRP